MRQKFCCRFRMERPRPLPLRGPVIEELPRECLSGAFLEVDEQRYGSDDIRRLYDSAKYPLARRSARS